MFNFILDKLRQDKNKYVDKYDFEKIVIGKTIEEVKNNLSLSTYKVRVVESDGKSEKIIKDLNRNRLNVRVTSNKISGIVNWG